MTKYKERSSQVEFETLLDSEALTGAPIFSGQTSKFLYIILFSGWRPFYFFHLKTEKQFD